MFYSLFVFYASMVQREMTFIAAAKSHLDHVFRSCLLLPESLRMEASPFTDPLNHTHPRFQSLHSPDADSASDAQTIPLIEPSPATLQSSDNP